MMGLFAQVRRSIYTIIYLVIPVGLQMLARPQRCSAQGHSKRRYHIPCGGEKSAKSLPCLADNALTGDAAPPEAAALY